MLQPFKMGNSERLFLLVQSLTQQILVYDYKTFALLAMQRHHI